MFVGLCPTDLKLSCLILHIFHTGSENFFKIRFKGFLDLSHKKPKILISLTDDLRKIVYIGKSVAREKM